MLSPTCLPSGLGLRYLAIDAICDAPPRRADFAFLKRVVRDVGERLVPELVFQRLAETLTSRFDSFFEVIDGASPNAAHHLLAGLSTTARVRLATTNFDTSLGDDRSVVHLHGHLRKRKRMVTQLSQVAKGLPCRLEMESQATFAGRTVFVLGYSGNDQDVMRTLSVAHPREVLCGVDPIAWTVWLRGLSHLSFEGRGTHSTRG
jgi:hypothetical protein